jgi:DeoR family transcriptional regulator of aga operon
MSNNSTVERRASILKVIEENGLADVNTLSKKFGVSEVTIRKDLRYLEKRNMLMRSRGGAFKQSIIDKYPSIFERRKQKMPLK